MPSNAELAARVVVGLLEAYERRTKAMESLASTMADATGELDPRHERADTDWASLPAWLRHNGLGRLYSNYAELVDIEGRATEVAEGLHRLFSARQAGVGQISPLRAHVTLMGLSVRRVVLLRELELAERSVRPKLDEPTSGRLRAAIRAVQEEEFEASKQHARLADLLVDTPG